MIEEAQPRPDDVCEVDGDQINEVSVVNKRKSARKSCIEFNGWWAKLRVYRSV